MLGFNFDVCYEIHPWGVERGKEQKHLKIMRLPQLDLINALQKYNMKITLT